MDLDWREVLSCEVGGVLWNVPSKGESKVSISITSPDSDGTKAILSRCSGRVKMGRMVAVVGPSGAGKTTLLSCLCQDLPHEGTVTYDGARFSSAVRQLIGFCEQEDVVPGCVTVEQFLMFYAQMRFGIGDPRASASIAERLNFVQLGKVVATPIHGLSAGERKRLCIARELLSEPKLLLCDEPTRGLDVLAAYQVMAVIRALCDSGRTSCLTTMHQPPTKIFEQFQDLILMRRGEMVFFGPTCQVEPIFASVGLRRPPTQSIAEYLIDCLGKDPHEPGGMTPEMHAQFLARARRLCGALPQVITPLADDGVCRYQASFQRQLYLLTQRFATQASQDLFNSMLLIQHTLEMAIAGFAWWQLAYREADVRSRFAICNWIVAHWCTYGTQMHMFTWSLLQPQLKKDIRAGVYSAPAVFFARVVMLAPLEIVWPTYYTTGIICLTNVAPDFQSACQVVVVTWLIYSLYQASSLAVGALFKDFVNVQCVVFLFLTYSLIWSGFWVDVNRLPGLLAYFQYGNPLWYALILLTHSVLPDDAQFSCETAYADANGCRWNYDGKLVLFGPEARARHRVIGQIPPWMCVCVLCSLLAFWWLVGFLALQWSMQKDWDVSQEDEDVAAESIEDDQGRVLTFKTSWASSSRESMHNDASQLSDSWQQQRSALL